MSATSVPLTSLMTDPHGLLPGDAVVSGAPAGAQLVAVVQRTTFWDWSFIVATVVLVGVGSVLAATGGPRRGAGWGLLMAGVVVRVVAVTTRFRPRVAYTSDVLGLLGMSNEAARALGPAFAPYLTDERRHRRRCPVYATPDGLQIRLDPPHPPIRLRDLGLVLALAVQSDGSMGFVARLVGDDRSAIVKVSIFPRVGEVTAA